MKKLLGILVLGLFWCNFSNAGTTSINETIWERKIIDSETGMVDTWIYEFSNNNRCSYIFTETIRMPVDGPGPWGPYHDCTYSENKNNMLLSINKGYLTCQLTNKGKTLEGTCKSKSTLFKNKIIPFNAKLISGSTGSTSEPSKPEKPKFASKEKQYEHTCGKALGLRKGSKRFLECSLKIMEMELELTKLQAEKEVALARAETAMANQQTAKAAELNAMANAKSQKFKKNVGNLLLGLLVLGEINSASQQANSFKKVFTCSSTGFATGTQYAVNCY